MADESSTVGTLVLGIIASVVASVIGAFVILFNLLESKNSGAIVDLQTRLKWSEDRHEACEKDRDAQAKLIHENTRAIDALNFRINGLKS